MKNIAQNVEKWMSCPSITTEFPGLAYICCLDELVVARKLDALHNVIGKHGVCYTIFNNDGNKVFLAVQQNKYCKFDIQIFNYYGNEVIQIRKPFSNKIQVWAPPGHLVGSVEQAWTYRNTFVVKNSLGNVVLKVKANSSSCGQYDVLSNDEIVGKIKNKWHVCALVDRNNIGVTFPLEMGVGDKAVLLGACFLIGYLK